MSEPWTAAEQDKEWLSNADWLARHEEFIARRKAGPIDVLLLGDSITQGWNGAGLSFWKSDFEALNTANFGIGGDATEHVLWRIQNGELEHISPKVLSLLIGTNNIGNEGHSGADTVKGVDAILEIIQRKLPNTQVILNAVFPRDEKPGTPFRKEVRDLNEGIFKLVDKYNVTLVDIRDQFLMDDGSIPESLMPDYLHLSERGYRIWRDALIPEIKRLLG